MDQEFPESGLGGPETAPVIDNRPLIERIGDKNWKTRLTAYEDLRKDIKATLGDDPLFQEFASWIPKMVADANAGALDAGLDTAILFADMAPVGSDGTSSTLRPYYDKIFLNVVEKAFGARLSTQNKGKALLMKIMETDEPTACAQFLLSKLGDKKPKVPPTCLEVIKDGIAAFGARTFPVKEIIAAMGSVLNGTNGPARETALNLMVDLTRWIGKAPFNALLESIRSAQKSEFEKLMADIEAKELPPPVPSLYTRKNRPAPGSASLESQAVGNAPGKKNPAGVTGDQGDGREYIDEVDLTKKLKPTDYVNLLADEKWSEQLKGLQVIIDAIGPTPKLKPGCEIIYDILQTCKNFLRQGHLQLQVSSIKVVTLLADGLRNQEYANLVRPLLQTVAQKSKEKRLINDVQTCLTVVLKHCLSSIEPLLEDLTECIKNKKNPPHGRVCILEFVSSIFAPAPSGFHDKVSNEHLKVITEALASCCEDSDPKVRDSSVGSLAIIAPVIKSRGRVAIDSHKIIMALETSAPRVFKKIQVAMEGGSPVIPVAGTSTSSAGAGRSTGGSVEVTKKSVPLPSSSTGGSSATAAKKSTMSSATSSSSGSAVSKKSSNSQATAADDDNVEDITMSPEDAQNALAELNIPNWDSAFQELMASAKWQERVEALTLLGQHVADAKAGGKLAAPLVMYLSAKTSGFKISNINILKALITVACQAAQNVEPGGVKFSKPAAWELIKHLGDKLSDKKTTDLVNSLLTAFSEAISPTFVVKRMKVVMDKVKAVTAHQYYLEWLKGAIVEFGSSAFPLQFIASFCQLELDNKIASVRTAAVEVLGQLYNQIGPKLVAIAVADDMKPQLKAILEAEFAKVGYDPAAASKASRATTDGVPGSDSGGIPRQDILSLMDKNTMSELTLIEGKTSWQNRKTAIEAVLQACEKSGHYLDCSKGTVELIKQLKVRINDTQANLKPLAVAAIGHIIASVEIEMGAKLLRLVASSTGLFSGIADNKKQMRDATISAMQVAVTLNKSSVSVTPENIASVVGYSDAESSLLAVLIPPIAEALSNPIGRHELLAWMLQHIDSLKFDCSDLSSSLVLCMQDKIAVVRVFGEALMYGLVCRGWILKSAVDKSTRDLPPSTKRTLQPSIEKMMAATVAKKGQDGGSSAGAINSSSSSGSATAASTASSSNTSAIPSARPSGIAKSGSVSSSSGIPSSMGSPLKKLGMKSVASSLAPAVLAPIVNEEVIVNDSWALKKTAKSKRMDEFYKQNWPQPPAEVTDNELQNLKSIWEPLISSELALNVFKFCGVANSLAVNQDTMVPVMNELTKQLESPFAVQHTDLILRWCGYVLSIRETPSGLLRLLQLISDVFLLLQKESQILHDAEITCILPHLIDKSGHKSERHKQAFKNTIALASDVIAPNKLNTFLLQGLGSKNKKSRVICLEEIQRVVESSGIASLSKSSFKEIGSLLDCKDNELSVRLAGLELCYALYLALNANGDVQKLIKLMGDLSERTSSMIDESIRKKNKHQHPATSLSTASLQAPPSLTNAASSIGDSRSQLIEVGVPFRNEPIDAMDIDNSFSDNQEFMQDSVVDNAAPFKLNITPPRSSHATSSFRQTVAGVATQQSLPASLQLKLETSPMFLSARESILEPISDTWRDVGGSAISPIASAHHAQTTSFGSQQVPGIYADIVRKLDLLLTAPQNITARERENLHEQARDYIKILNEVVSGTWSRRESSEVPEEVSVLVTVSEQLISRLVQCINLGFHRPVFAFLTKDFPDIGLDVSLISVSLAALFQIIKRPDVTRLGLSLNGLIQLLSSCFLKMVDERLTINTVNLNDESFEVAGNITKALNMVVLRVASDANSGVVIQALLRILLESGIQKASDENISGEVTQPALRLLLHVLSKEAAKATNAYIAPSFNTKDVLNELHVFFTRHPSILTENDKPFRGAKTVLNEMVSKLSPAIVMGYLRDLDIPMSSFVYKLTAKLGNVSLEETDPEVSAKLVKLMDEITSAKEKLVPIKKLHAFKRENPNVDINAYLHRISTAFRRYVLDTFSQLDEDAENFESNGPHEPNASRSPTLSKSSDGFSNQGFSVLGDSSGSNASEALRIIEELKKDKPATSSYMSRSSLSGATGSTPLRSRSINAGDRQSFKPATPRARIQDQVRGSLNSLSMQLELPILDGVSGIIGGTNSALPSDSDSDLSLRYSRLKSMAPK